MNFNKWLKIGRKNKWVSQPVCDTHEGLPMTEEEIMKWDGDECEPCIHVLRLYSSPEEFIDAEGDN